MSRRTPLIRDVRVSAFVKAEPEQVYRALTSARELCVWWLDRAETDARNTGRFRLVWPAGCKGLGPEARGVFVDLEPGQKVAWMLDDRTASKRLPPLVSFFIEKRPRGCQVTVLHAGFAGAASQAKAVREAWEDAVAKLKLYLETGRTRKPERVRLAAEAR